MAPELSDMASSWRFLRVDSVLGSVEAATAGLGRVERVVGSLFVGEFAFFLAAGSARERSLGTQQDILSGRDEPT